MESKVNELREAVGKEFSDNHSNTLRSVLLSVSKCGNVCYTMSVDAYDKKGGIAKKQPSWLTWNAMFY
jgi:hypothetical protein